MESMGVIGQDRVIRVTTKPGDRGTSLDPAVFNASSEPLPSVRQNDHPGRR